MSYTAKNQLICHHVENQTNIFNTPVGNKQQKQFPFTFAVPNVVSSFQGREEEVDNLDRLFDTSTTVAVHGLGGYGKTELACRYADVRREKYTGNRVWIKGETKDLLERSFRAVALELRISDCEKRDIKCVTEDVYNYFEEMRVLFIFDNAQDRRSILEFLPQSFKLKNADSVNVLVTSQCTTWGNHVSVLPLKELSLEYALQVLSAVTGEEKFKSISRDEWKQLAETFYCIPLGLQIAAAYVKQRLSSNLSGDFSVLKYIARIQEKNMLFDKKLPVDSDSNYEKSIYKSLYFTVEKIEKSDDEESKWALDLINVCAYLNPDDIIVEVLLDLPVIGRSVDKLEEALSVLEQYSLFIGIESNMFNQTAIRVHRLVQMFFRYHQEKGQTVTKFYKDSLNTVVNINTQCLHVLKYINCLKILLESLTVAEKKAMIDGWKLLHVASENLLLGVMELLLQHDADVNSTNTGTNDTPLFSLMVNADYFHTNRSSWEDAVRLLLQHNANTTTARGYEGKTILHSAARWRCPTLIAYILGKCQFDVDVRNRDGCTPLHFVSLEKICDEAELTSAMECIKILVNRSANINAIDNNGRSVLHYSVITGNWPLTQFLTTQFEINRDMRDRGGNTPLLLVSSRILGPYLEELIDNYSLNVNIRDHSHSSPLHFFTGICIWNEAEMEEVKEVVQALLKKDTDISATNLKGVSILSFALFTRNSLLVAYILEKYEINVNQQDGKGRTPLLWTVMKIIPDDIDQKRVEAIVELLISKEANPSIKDHRSNTILHYCALLLNSQMLKFFIDQHNLNPNEQNVDGFTALHVIAEVEFRNESLTNRSVSCIEVLRSRGARVDLVNNQGLTPAQLEESKCNSELFDLTSYLK